MSDKPFDKLWNEILLEARLSKQPRAFYFGYSQGSGHTFRGPNGGYLDGKEFDVSPWKTGELDARMQPHFSNCVSRPPQSSKYCACYRGPEGVALVHRRAGWTALSFWDRSGDRRANSNTTFVLEGEFDFAGALALAREFFPTIFARFTFEIREYVEPAT